MANYILMVFTDPMPGQEDEYNRWYDDIHITELLEKVPGIESAKRYTEDATSPESLDRKYLAIYELETDDPNTVMADLARLAESGEMNVSPALDGDNSRLMIFKAR